MRRHGRFGQCGHMYERIPIQTPNPIPGPRRVVDTVRVMRALTSDPCPALDSASERFGSTFAVGRRPLQMVVVGDAQHLADLFATPSDAFRWGHVFNVLRFFVGDGSMIVSDGDDHRRRRGSVQSGFARRHLDEWVAMIVRETDRTIDEELGADGVVDVFPVERSLVLRMVLNVLFGAGLNERAVEIGKLMEPAKEYLEQSALRQLPHPFPHTKRSRARAARQELDRIVDAEMERRRAAPSAASSDLLDTLLAARGPEQLTDAEIRDQVVTLIGAGYDTTTSALSWATLRAASDPDVWQRLRTEADEVLVGELGPATVPRLTYAGAVVRETLRLHPAGVFSPRQAVRDVQVGPFVIAAKTMILWSPYLAGRDPAIWDDPLTFRPERHLDPVPAAKAVMDAAWVPFGRGARRCIGFALAQMELTLAVSRLAQRVDVTLERADIPPPYGMVVNRPTGGVRATVRARPSISLR